MKTFVATYIGLPDMQYKDVTVFANNRIEARDLSDFLLLTEYGKDNFDCILVREPKFHNN